MPAPQSVYRSAAPDAGTARAWARSLSDAEALAARLARWRVQQALLVALVPMGLGRLADGAARLLGAAPALPGPQHAVATAAALSAGVACLLGAALGLHRARRERALERAELRRRVADLAATRADGLGSVPLTARLARLADLAGAGSPPPGPA